VYAGVSLTTASTLILELSLTRLFSVIFYYHFAFLAISIALFGLGAGGVVSYFFPQRGRALYRRLGIVSAANAVVTVLTLTYLLGQHGGTSFTSLGTVYIAASLPFLFSGVVVSLAISESIARVEKVYFWDLAGAATGCLALIPLLDVVGAPGAILASAVLSASASAVWFGLAKTVRGRALGVALALALVTLITYNKQSHILDLRTAKGTELRGEHFVQWNSFSRIAVKDDPGGGQIVAIDADATTGISQFNIDHLSQSEQTNLAAEGPGFVYCVRPGGKTLILGAGGGWDVARALASGSHDVTGVEINPIIATTIMRKNYAKLSHGIYLRPDVRIIVEDGRSYVRRSSERYQVLQATLVDTWASTAAGAFALSENNLYTTDAFLDYLNHLTPDGVLAFTRWGFEPPRESLRLVSLAREALSRLGENEAWRHIVVVREKGSRLRHWGATDTVLISRKPFSPADLAKVHETAARGFELIYAPDAQGTTPFHGLLSAAKVDNFYDGYRFDVRPVPDDRPFFFYTVQARDVWSFLGSFNHESADFKVNLALPALFALLGVSAIATLVTLLLPPLVLGARLPRERGVMLFLPYFVLLGVGYIVIQVGLIQKLILLLGHPTYALTVVVFSMLLFSGLGSFASRRLVNRDEKRLRFVPLAVAVAVALLAVLVTPVSSALVAAPSFVRLLCAALLVAPAGFLMGMPFPGGLALLEAWQPMAVRWAWSMNAAASVLGSALSICCAIYMGLRNTLLLGSLCYVAAAMVLFLTARYRREAAGVKQSPKVAV
jgi:hypothetical protein